MAGRYSAADTKQDLQEWIEPTILPPWVRLTKKQNEIFQELCKCRVTWNTAEIELIVRYVKNQEIILKMERELKSIGYTQYDQHGVEKERPQVKILKSFTVENRNILRSIGLTQTDNRAKNSRGATMNGINERGQKIEEGEVVVNSML